MCAKIALGRRREFLPFWDHQHWIKQPSNHSQSIVGVMMKAIIVSLTQQILLWTVWGATPSIASQEPLIEWLKAKPNGFFSDKIEWKPLDPSNPDSTYAMFASQDIPKNEALIVVPQSALISSKDTGHRCDTVKMLLEEAKKGKNSDYFPYIDYLFGDSSKRGILPSSWSEPGQQLLHFVIGNTLFPAGFNYHRIEDFCPEIAENPSQLEQDAYLFVVSRSWDDVMIPGMFKITTVSFLSVLSGNATSVFLPLVSSTLISFVTCFDLSSLRHD